MPDRRFPLSKLLSRRALGWVVRRATLPRWVRVGRRCRIDASVSFARNSGTITIGDNVQIFRGSELLAPVTIGDRVFVNRDAYIRAGTVIGDDVNIGPFVRFVTDDHHISNEVRRAGEALFRPITVGDGCWIGANATILGGVTLGRGAIVAAGALVNRDVPPDTLVGGTPARPIRDLPPLAARGGGQPAVGSTAVA